MRTRILIKELTCAECKHLQRNPFSNQKECTNMLITGRYIEFCAVDTSKCKFCKYFSPIGLTLQDLKRKITPKIEEEILCYTEGDTHLKAEVLADIVLNKLLEEGRK